MLEITINGTKADLSSNTVINLNYNSSVFDFGKFSGTYSTSFTLPLTSENRKLFGYADNLHIEYTGQKYSCEIYFSGAQIEAGVLMLKRASENGFSCYLTFGEASFVSMVKEKNLKSIDWKYGHCNWFNPVFSPENNSSTLCQFKNEKFYNGTNKATYQNRFYYNEDKYAHYNYKTVPPEEFENHLSPITPFPYLTHILHKTFNHFGYNLVENILDEGELKHLALYSNYDIAEYEERGMYYGEDVDEEGNTIPDSDKQWVEFLHRNDKFTFPYAEIVPDIEVHAFLLSVLNYFGLSLIIDGANVSIKKISDLLRVDALAQIDLESIENNTLPYTGYMLMSKRGYHTHDNKIPVNSNYVGFGQLGAGIDTRPELVSVGDYRFDEGPVYYHYDYKTTEGIKQYTPCQDYRFGSEERVWEIKNTITLPGDGTYVSNDVLQVGANRQEFGQTIYFYTKGMEGRGSGYNEDKTVKDVILFFANLNQFGVRTLNIPRVGTVNPDNEFVFEHGLAFPGSNGVFKKFHEQIAHWAINQRKEFTAEFYPTVAFLAKHKPWNKYSFEGTNFFITEMQVSIGMNAISKAKIKAVTAP